MQVQPDPVQSVPGFGIREAARRGAARVPRDPAGGRLCGDHAQDAWRRHRRGMRTTRRQGGRQERSRDEKNAQGGSVKKWMTSLMVAALLAGCAATQPGAGGNITSEADSETHQRARAFTDLAAAYY